MNQARYLPALLLATAGLAACKPRHPAATSDLAASTKAVCTADALSDLRAVLTAGGLGSTSILVDLRDAAPDNSQTLIEVPPSGPDDDNPANFEGGVPGNVATMTPIKRQSDAAELASAARNPQSIVYLSIKADKKLGPVAAESTVRTLRFMHCLPEITGFALEGIALADFSDLRVAKKLTTLTIEQAELEDLEFLKPLGKLNYLSLPSNRIKDVHPIMYLPLLVRLDISNNKGITDIMAVKDIPYLEELWISDCSVKDLSPLSGHDFLEQIDGTRNELTSLKGLDQLPKLRDLFVSNNRLTTIDDLSALPSLRQLALGRNCMRTVSGLERFPALEWLALTENPVRQLPTGLKSGSLESLDLTGIPATSWEPMKTWSLPKLRHVRADLSRATDMGPIDRFRSLAVLVARGGDFQALPKLWSMPDLGILNIAGSRFERLDLGNLAGPGILQWITVDLSKSRVESVVLPAHPTERQITLTTDDEAYTGRLRRFIPNDRRIWAETSTRHELDVGSTTSQALPKPTDPQDVPYLAGACPD